MKSKSAEARSSALVSVIVTVTERPEPVVELYREFSGALEEAGLGFEFVFVGEPWTANVLAPLERLVADGDPIKVLLSGQTVGEARLVMAGLRHCKGDVIVVLPCYRRISANGIPELLSHLVPGVDMAIARRWPRRGNWIKRVQGRTFSFLVRHLVGGNLEDVSSGVLASRRSVLEEVPVYGDFLRFLPILAWREGFRVVEVKLPQHEIDRAPRLYKPGIYLRRVIDLFGLYFLVRFTEKPLRFFGLTGATASFAGVILLLVLTVQRLRGTGIANRPLLVGAVLMVVLGVQAIALGLVGELVVHLNAHRRVRYKLHKMDIDDLSQMKSESGL